VHFPADEDDVREVLRRLPRGVTDGLARVDLRLGALTQEEQADSTDRRDPHVGRLGSERFPGAWSGWVLGQYGWDVAEIELFAFVFDPAHPLRSVWEPLLRLDALSTLAHEVAHHHDDTCRKARGRWRASGYERVERYAQERQDVWTREIIIPYLRERYGDEIREVERWIERYGGISLRFEELFDDPRVTAWRGTRKAATVVFRMDGAIRGLMGDVLAGKPEWEYRLGFATELHYQDRFTEALEIVDAILRERPDDPLLLVERADLLVHLERHAEALAVAEPLVAADPTLVHAWEAVLRASARTGDWPRAQAAATRLLEIAEASEYPEPERSGALLDRAEARLRQGDRDGARADLDRIPRPFKRAEKLRAELDASEP
jgi:tetratricopeptide (TPR) repeat protein